MVVLLPLPYAAHAVQRLHTVASLFTTLYLHNRNAKLAQHIRGLSSLETAENGGTKQCKKKKRKQKKKQSELPHH